jgi:hypothetical protein
VVIQAAEGLCCEKLPFDMPSVLRMIFPSIPSSPEQSEGRLEGCCIKSNKVLDVFKETALAGSNPAAMAWI